MIRVSSWVVLCLCSVGLALPRSVQREIEQFQKEKAEKGWTFEIGETPISDKNIWDITGYNPNVGVDDDMEYNDIVVSRVLPAKWDWRDKGVVTEIRDQAKPQYCGSCWAFGTVAALESAIQIKDGVKNIHISEQQLVSCQPSYGTCSGGNYAFGFYKSRGAAYEEEFPYKAANVSCKAGLPQHEKIVSWGSVGAKNRAPSTEQIKTAIYKYGPVAVTVSASGAWSHYKGGIYNECNSNSTNHIVALVGWNDETQTWILKNSHGTEWGDKGYMHIKYVGANGGKCNQVGRTAAYVIYKN